MSFAGDWFGIGIGVGVAVGFICVCVCYCCAIETRSIIEMVFDNQLGSAGKPFVDTPYGVVEEKDCKYVREKCKNLEYVRYNPEVRPSQPAINMHALLNDAIAKARAATRANPKGFVEASRAQEVQLEKIFLSCLNMVPHVDIQHEEKTGHVFLRNKGVSNNQWVFWIHGGGYSCGRAGVSALALQRLCKASGCVGVSLNYPLAPETSVGEMSDFILTEIDRILSENSAGDDVRVVLAGENSGAGLAIKVAFDAIEQSRRRPDILCLVSPILNFQSDTPSYKENDKIDYYWTEDVLGWGPYVVQNLDVNGESTGNDNPIPRGFDGDWSQLPPTYIMVGGLEVFLDDSVDVGQKMFDANVEVVVDVEPFMFHAYCLYGYGSFAIPEATGAILRASSFVLEHLNRVSIAVSE